MTQNQQNQSPHYVIDSSCIIAGFNDMYAETVFPTLWNRVGDLITNGTVLVIQEVIDEVGVQNDAPSGWIKQFKYEHNRFSGYQQKAVQEYAIIANKGISAEPIETDVMLVAWAKATNSTVVTQEKLGGGGHKIPKICDEEGVACTNMLGMMKAQGWTFR